MRQPNVKHDLARGLAIAASISIRHQIQGRRAKSVSAKCVKSVEVINAQFSDRPRVAFAVTGQRIVCSDTTSGQLKTNYEEIFYAMMPSSRVKLLVMVELLALDILFRNDL